MKSYVCGFMFSSDCSRVLLIEKNRPNFQKGKLNGIGGKIEASDLTIVDAMIREFREETSIETTVDDWTKLAVLYGIDWIVSFFYSFSEKHSLAQTTTDETIYSIRVNTLKTKNLMSNLHVLIPLALDTSGLVKPVIFVDNG